VRLLAVHLRTSATGAEAVVLWVMAGATHDPPARRCYGV
jgi:hypothetical protein